MRNRQGITIAALIVAIIGLSVGFAAFSNTLTIRSTASVNPGSENFVVKFSKVSNADQTGSSYPIIPIISAANVEAGVTGGDGEIDSSNPLLLTGLQANFNAPGQSVSYKLYVRNTGHYTAYLTNLDFKDIAGGDSFIDCSGNDVTTALKTAACNDISVSVTIGGTDGVGGDTYTSRDQTLTNEINTITLNAGASAEVYVTINYAANNHYVDGNMTVTFGDIMLEYRSVNTPLAIPDPVPQDNSDCVVTNVKSFGSSCTLSQDNDSSNSVTKGDKITCGTEGFYVIENPSNGTTKMLAEWNLNISDGILYEFEDEEPYSTSFKYCSSTEGYQDSHVRGYVDEEEPDNLQYLVYDDFYEEYLGYGVVPFVNTYDPITKEMQYGDGYWTSGGSLNTSVYTACSGDYCNEYDSNYPAYVYDNNAILKTFVDTYVGYLRSALNLNSNQASGRLISYEELEALGCDGSEETCESAPSWVYQTSYWSGSADGSGSVWYVNSNGLFGSSDFGSSYNLGARPVIEISSSAIQTS